MRRSLTTIFSTSTAAAFWQLHQYQQDVSLFKSWLGDDFPFARLLDVVGPHQFASTVAALRMVALSKSMVGGISVSQISAVQAQLKLALDRWTLEQQMLVARAQARQRMERWLERLPAIGRSEKKRLATQMETLDRLGYAFELTPDSKTPSLTNKTIQIGEQTSAHPSPLIFFFSQVIIGERARYVDGRQYESHSSDVLTWFEKRAALLLSTTNGKEEAATQQLTVRLEKALQALVIHHWQFSAIRSNDVSLIVDPNRRVVLVNPLTHSTLSRLLIPLEHEAQNATRPSSMEYLISRFGNGPDWCSLPTHVAEWLRDHADNPARYGRTVDDFVKKVFANLKPASPSTPLSDLQIWRELADFLNVEDGPAARAMLEKMEQAFQARSTRVEGNGEGGPNVARNDVSINRLKELRPLFDWTPLLKHGVGAVSHAVVAFLESDQRGAEQPRISSLAGPAKVMGYTSPNAFANDLRQAPRQGASGESGLGIYSENFRKSTQGWHQDLQDVLDVLLQTLHSGTQDQSVTLASLIEALQKAFQTLRPWGHLRPWMKQLASAIAPQDRGYPHVNLDSLNLSADERAVAEVLIRLKPHLTIQYDKMIDRLLGIR